MVCISLGRAVIGLFSKGQYLCKRGKLPLGSTVKTYKNTVLQGNSLREGSCYNYLIPPVELEGYFKPKQSKPLYSLAVRISLGRAVIGVFSKGVPNMVTCASLPVSEENYR